jgi:hypothetical protein
MKEQYVFIGPENTRITGAGMNLQNTLCTRDSMEDPVFVTIGTTIHFSSGFLLDPIQTKVGLHVWATVQKTQQDTNPLSGYTGGQTPLPALPPWTCQSRYSSVPFEQCL